MSKRKLLSDDLETLTITVDKIMEKWGVNDTEYSKKIKELIREMRMSSIIEEEFKKKNEPYNLIPSNVELVFRIN